MSTSVPWSTTALTNNATYLKDAGANPSAAQLAGQVDALTKQVDAIIQTLINAKLMA